MFCNKCGAENVEAASFCLKCGVKIGQVSSSDSSNTYLWALTIVPLFLGVAGLVFSAFFESQVSSAISIVCSLAINVGLVVADSKQLAKRNIDIDVMLGILLVPVYLYRRAKLTSSSQLGLLVWGGSLILSMLLSLIGTLFVGTQVSTAATETAIKNWMVNASLADSSAIVTCPDSVLSKAGATFICSVDTYPETTLQVRIENIEGDVTWQIIG